MNLARTWAVFRKEVIHIRRDLFSLLQVILMPIILLLLYGYALTFDIKHVTIAIYDQERSQLSEDFINQFRSNEYFELKYFTDSYARLKDLVTQRRVEVGLMLPYNYSWLYQTGKTVPIQALVDGTDANTANIVLGYVGGVASAYNQRLLMQRLMIKGPARVDMPVDVQTRYWFNEDLESRNFIVPSMIAIIMTMVGSMLTALTVVRELERGSLEGLLATPLKKTELLLGKLGPYFIIGMFDMFVVMAMGKFLFQVPLRGDPLLLIGR
jgi:ABC-2 type transport system permease protein